MQAEIDAALTGAASEVTLYWDTQDPNAVGPAYRTGDDCGPLEFFGFVGADDKTLYTLESFFGGPDQTYLGPDQDGVYPELELTL